MSRDREALQIAITSMPLSCGSSGEASNIRTWWQTHEDLLRRVAPTLTESYKWLGSVTGPPRTSFSNPIFKMIESAYLPPHVRRDRAKAEYNEKRYGATAAVQLLIFRGGLQAICEQL